VRAIQIDDDDCDCIQIGALEVEQLLSEVKERIKEQALPDEKY